MPYSDTLVKFGADPVGIDRKALDDEPFESYQVDLSVPGALDFLPDKSFDYVHTKNLVGQNPTPDLTGGDGYLRSDLQKITNEIFKQTRRLLIEGGFLILMMKSEKKEPENSFHSKSSDLLFLNGWSGLERRDLDTLYAFVYSLS